MLIIAALIAKSQNEQKYLFEKSKISVSAFGAPYGTFSMLNGDFAFSGGGGAALLFNGGFFLGGYGEGLATHHERTGLDSVVLIHNPRISFRHGGVWLGYAYKPGNMIHAAISGKVGWGTISLFDPDSDPDYQGNKAKDRVMVFTPQIEIEMNLTPWLKLNVGVGYRLLAGMDRSYRFKNETNTTRYYDTKDYNSPVGTISILVGGFARKTEK